MRQGKCQGHIIRSVVLKDLTHMKNQQSISLGEWLMGERQTLLRTKVFMKSGKIWSPTSWIDTQHRRRITYFLHRVFKSSMFESPSHWYLKFKRQTFIIAHVSTSLCCFFHQKSAIKFQTNANIYLLYTISTEYMIIFMTADIERKLPEQRSK